MNQLLRSLTCMKLSVINLKPLVIACGVLMLGVAMAANAAETRSLELFGVVLKGASRDQLRQAFKKNGLRAKREDARYWVDTYSAKGVLDGASDFKAGYASASGKFAFAQYTFPAFMDRQLVAKIIKLVSAKYGQPDNLEGYLEVGEVTAVWNMGQNMRVSVSRGWPNTTTYLTYTDLTENSQMNEEIEAEKAAQTAHKARAQSNAF